MKPKKFKHFKELLYIDSIIVKAAYGFALAMLVIALILWVFK